MRSKADKLMLVRGGGGEGPAGQAAGGSAPMAATAGRNRAKGEFAESPSLSARSASRLGARTSKPSPRKRAEARMKG